ncbi:MAG TPA: anhydro-N-acetylmuramic acid kinase [Acidiferrobacteraceae bacterium]|nr:anhydro-N-acetylmuramic acid kinase [Acidiferrobacteraceae bacterium]
MMYYIGLMSGTSADGIDAALMQIGDGGKVNFLAARVLTYPTPIREAVLAFKHPADDELERAGVLNVELGELFAQAALELLEQQGLPANKISAIGSHGQTLRHQPTGPHPYSIQIADPATIVERTGITTVANFRTRDIAAGGQGAPLASAFHRAAFHNANQNRVILNIGGIANVTFLPHDPGDPVVGFDTGPGNNLMDGWTERHKGQCFDVNGEWAQQGVVSTALLKRLLDHPYFPEHPPKTTGPEDFNLQWLDGVVEKTPSTICAEDAQATLLQLTACSISQTISQYLPKTQAVYVCGGGTHNKTLMSTLQQKLGDTPVATTSKLGIDPDWVEACAFAWMAWRTLNGKSGNITSVTGARHEAPLGAIWIK